MPAPCASRCYSCASLAGPCACESGSDNPVSLPLCLMSRSLANKCHGRLIVLRWLFCATAESYLAFVQMESSKGESADDTYAEQLGTGIAPAYSRVGEGVRLLWRKQIVRLWTACGRYTAERRKPLKSVLLGCRATFLSCITYLHARHVLCTVCMPSLIIFLTCVCTGNMGTQHTFAIVTHLGCSSLLFHAPAERYLSLFHIRWLGLS